MVIGVADSCTEAATLAPDDGTIYILIHTGANVWSLFTVLLQSLWKTNWVQQIHGMACCVFLSSSHLDSTVSWTSSVLLCSRGMLFALIKCDDCEWFQSSMHWVKVCVAVLCLIFNSYYINDGSSCPCCYERYNFFNILMRLLSFTITSSCTWTYFTFASNRGHPWTTTHKYVDRKFSRSATSLERWL